MTRHDWAVKVKERDGNRCAICGASGRLYAHHIQHEAVNWNRRTDINNGVTLCGRCHILAHRGSFNALHPRMSARETFAALKSRAGDRDVDTLIDRLILGSNDHEDLAKEYRSRPASSVPSYPDDAPPWPVMDAEVLSGPGSPW